MSRAEKIARIQDQIRNEMILAKVSGEPYRRLLDLLGKGTRSGWRHQFITTNWDFLLQREILRLGLTVLPPWLANSHVSHMNGTVEILPNNANRSPFLLEDDPSTQRTWSIEANVVYNKMICGQYFVVVGVSFECDTDRFLLKALGDFEDDLEVGESHWIVLNPDQAALDKVICAIQQHLPRATITPVQRTFGQWLDNRMPELRLLGALAV